MWNSCWTHHWHGCGGVDASAGAVLTVLLELRAHFLLPRALPGSIRSHVSNNRLRANEQNESANRRRVWGNVTQSQRSKGSWKRRHVDLDPFKAIRSSPPPHPPSSFRDKDRRLQGHFQRASFTIAGLSELWFVEFSGGCRSQPRFPLRIYFYKGNNRCAFAIVLSYSSPLPCTIFLE